MWKAYEILRCIARRKTGRAGTKVSNNGNCSKEIYHV